MSSYITQLEVFSTALLNKSNDLDEANKMLTESVKIYNQYKPHTALEYKAPNEVHRAF